MLSLDIYSSNLRRNKNNVWIPKIKRGIKTAYPSNGHSCCFGIENLSFWFRHRNNCVVTLVKNYPPNGAIFDIGGGNGYVTSLLYKNGFESILVEPSATGVKNALSRGISQAIAATLQEAQFKKNSIPAVGLFDVLEHMRDDRKFLKHLYDIMKLNGKIYITVPAFEMLWSAQDIYAHHFRRYTLKNITNLLRSLHFKVDYATYFFTFFPLPIFLLRTLPFKFKLAKIYTTRQFQKEMTSSVGLFNPVINFLLKWELNRIKKRKYIPFGSSIIIAAHKIK